MWWRLNLFLLRPETLAFGGKDPPCGTVGGLDLGGMEVTVYKLDSERILELGIMLLIDLFRRWNVLFVQRPSYCGFLLGAAIRFHVWSLGFCAGLLPRTARYRV